MNEKIRKLEESIAKDEKRIRQLQLEIEKKSQRLEVLRQDEILKQVSALQNKGVDMAAVFHAIDNYDSGLLLSMLKGNVENTSELESDAISHD